MRGLIIGSAACVLAPVSFGQVDLDPDVHYYTYAGLTHNMLILASADPRTGKSFSFARGKDDPKLTLYHRIPGELILEGYFNESTTNQTTAAYPNRLNQQYGIMGIARYRTPLHGNINFFGDAGLGFSLLRHSSLDLPLANDFMIGGGVGAEFHVGEKSAILLGARYIHSSNGGRKRPNFGENLAEFYLGYEWKK